ncbi:MAG: hypothetical protein GX868_03485 [Actinobacteria bacterium]|nr:hypothetical protein [Actinomycetota bacterium]
MSQNRGVPEAKLAFARWSVNTSLGWIVALWCVLGSVSVALSVFVDGGLYWLPTVFRLPSQVVVGTCVAAICLSLAVSGRWILWKIVAAVIALGWGLSELRVVGVGDTSWPLLVP